MKYLLKQSYSKRTVLIWFSITSAVYLVMVYITVPMVMQFAPDKAILDLRPLGYTLPEVISLFDDIGPEGRANYLTKQIPVDMIYPGLFGISYALILAYILQKLKQFNSFTIWYCILPIIGGLADYLENIGIITLLKSYPNLQNNTVSLTSTFSVIKSSATALYFTILIIALVMLGIKYLRRR